MYRSCAHEAHGVPLCPCPQSSPSGLGLVFHVVQGNRRISKMVVQYLLKYVVSVNLEAWKQERNHLERVTGS